MVLFCNTAAANFDIKQKQRLSMSLEQQDNVEPKFDKTDEMFVPFDTKLLQENDVNISGA